MHPNTMPATSLHNGQARGRDFEAAVDAGDRALEHSRLWEVSIDLLGILCADGHFESTNPAWGRALGWTAEEIRDTSILDLIHPDDADKVRAGLRTSPTASRCCTSKAGSGGPTAAIAGFPGWRCRKRIDFIAARAM